MPEPRDTKNTNTGTDSKLTDAIKPGETTSDTTTNDENQTWIVARDLNGEDVRIKSEDYAEWERNQDAERAKRR